MENNGVNKFFDNENIFNFNVEELKHVITDESKLVIGLFKFFEREKWKNSPDIQDGVENCVTFFYDRIPEFINIPENQFVFP